MTDGDADVIALTQLALRYARAVDSGDGEAYAAIFHPEGRLRSYHPDAEEPFSDATGSAELAAIPVAMREMFRSTAHQMTNHLVDVQGDTATGTLLCAARHRSLDPADDTSLVVVLRYEDRYERRDGEWRILDRQVRFLWSERHEVVDSGF